MMLRVSGIVIELVADMLRWPRLVLRSSQSIQAENLFLRRQLALYLERGVKPPADRSGYADWSDSAVAALDVATSYVKWSGTVTGADS